MKTLPWRAKAAIQTLVSKVPASESMYRLVQRIVGGAGGSITHRLDQVSEITTYLSNAGYSIRDRDLLEVGTGHHPIIPVALWLAGARTIKTLDLNPRLDRRLLPKLMDDFLTRRSEIEAALGTADQELLAARFEKLKEARVSSDILGTLGIEYRAPADARDTKLANDSLDLHFSVTVLEHIPPSVLDSIITEGFRILKPGGLAIHLIDLSDHFAHSDPRITAANFLRFSQREWERLAGNAFGYCNRLRRPECREIFMKAGFEVIMEGGRVDQRSLAAIKEGKLPVHGDFSRFTPEELATISYRVVARKPITRS